MDEDATKKSGERKRRAKKETLRAESGKKTGCRGQNVIILLWVGRRCCAAETDARQRVPTKMNFVHRAAPPDARQRVPTNGFHE
jgi:hypothetical protein